MKFRIILVLWKGHFFESSLFSFINVLQFSVYKFFMFLVRFILKYFIMGIAILKDTFFLSYFFYIPFMIFHYWCKEMQLIIYINLVSCYSVEFIYQF